MKSITLLSVSVLFLFLLPLPSYSESCPFGEVDCTGKCGGFTDANDDQYCDNGGLSEQESPAEEIPSGEMNEILSLTLPDVAEKYGIPEEALLVAIEENMGLSLSGTDATVSFLHDNNGLCVDSLLAILESLQTGEAIPAPEEGDLTGEALKSMTIQEASDYYGIETERLSKTIAEHFNIPAPSPETSLLSLHDGSGVGMHEVKVLISELEKETPPSDEVAAHEKPKVMTQAERYKFWEISVGTLLLLTLSFVLQKSKVISLLLHRRIWNILLLFAFLSVGISGMLLAVGIFVPFPWSMIEFHVWTGIAIFWISVFHIGERWRFFARMITGGRMP